MDSGTITRASLRRIGIALAAVLLLSVACALFALSRGGWSRAAESSAAPSASASGGPGKRTIKWVGCDISKASFIDAAAAAYAKKSGNAIEIEDGGATRGIRDVAAGKAHVGGSCRHALDVPEERGVKLIPVAWDALVVVVHPSNPVSTITRDELRGVLTGSISSWKSLSGEDAPIEVFERKGKMSGVGAGTRQLLFGSLDQEFTKSARLFDSTRPLEEALEEAPNAIAMTGISSARLRKLKMLAIEGREPTRENLISGRYLLYRPLYITVPEEPDPAVADFVAFLFSSEGEAIIRGTGTVTMSEGKALWDTFKDQMARK